jgi:mRNA interferase MazF
MAMIVEQKVRRGCIYLVDLSLQPGSGAGPGPSGGPGSSGRPKKRPALVVQNDLGNRFSETTIVVALSSKVPSRIYPFHVMLPQQMLGSPGIIMCEQVWTVGFERVDPEPLAECPSELMEQVDAALRVSLGLSPQTGGSDPSL